MPTQFWDKCGSDCNDCQFEEACADELETLTETTMTQTKW